MKKLFVTFLLICMLAIHAAAEVKTFKLTVLSDGDYGLTGRYEVPDIEIKVDYTENSVPQTRNNRHYFYPGNVIHIKMIEASEILSLTYTATTDQYNISPETVQCEDGTVELGKITFENPVRETAITVVKNLRLTSLVVTYQDITCPTPTFNVENGAEVSPGQEITVDKKNATSCELLVDDVKTEGESYTIPENAISGSEINLTANSSLVISKTQTLTATASIRVKVKSAIPTPTITKHECAITARSANGGWITGTYTLEIENYGGETLLHTIEASDDNGTGYTMLTDVTFVPQSPSVSGIAAKEAPRTTIAGTFKAKDPFLVDPDRTKDYLFRFSTAIDNQSAEAATSQTEVQSPASESTTTGIDSITTDADGTTSYYDIHGVRIDTPVHGAPYIKVCDGKTEKVLIKQ